MTFIQLGLVLVVFLLRVLSIHSSMTQERLQNNISCYIRCPDPRKVWNNPCGSCHHSRCKYEGCVYTGPLNTYWKPDPCTKCFCENGKKKCYPINCYQSDCFGYPKVKQPGECCAECDFGDSYDACSAIPKSFSWYNHGDPTCMKLVKHMCNKPFIYTKGKWYECTKQKGYRMVSDNPGCGHIVNEGYEDITKCAQREIANEEDIPPDYDPNPTCEPIPSGITCHQNLTYIMLILFYYSTKAMPQSS